MAEVTELVTALTGHDFSEAPAEQLTYQQLIDRHTGLDPVREDWSALREFCQSKSLDCSIDDRWEVAMDWLMASVIQPDMKGLVYVDDFPASMASLARLHPDNPELARRFELFIDGMEVANGFEELTDASEQRQRFVDENRQRRQTGKPEVTIDTAFLHALDAGIPDTSGVALGLDRLLMWSLQLDSVAQAMSFSPFTASS